MQEEAGREEEGEVERKRSRMYIAGLKQLCMFGQNPVLFIRLRLVF